MHIDYLGPFTVLHEGRSQPPTPPKLRQVLAMLAGSANEPVSVDRLVDEVWESSPPSSASSTMQTYIYHLRRNYQLNGTNGGNAALRTVPGGYMLEIDPSAVDGLAFTKSWDSLRRSWGRIPAEAALHEIQEALAFWHGGSAFDGVRRGPSLEAHRVQLGEQYEVVRTQRVDLELELGRHHELVVELREAVRNNEGNEGLIERLMLAFYRSGRRLDALEEYRLARRSSIDTFGLEPGAPLRRLHERMLRGDPDLDVKPQSLVVSGSTEFSPDTLPAASPLFVGREAELEQATSAITDCVHHPAVALVNGFPGAGRTEFCLQAVRRVWDKFPDGHLYANVAESTVSDAVAGFLAAAGFTAGRIPVSYEDRCHTFRSWASGRRLLVVLDEASDIESVRDILPTRPGSCCLVVSDRQCRAPFISASIAIGQLNTEDAVNLLTRQLGANRVNQDLDDIGRLVITCGGLPGLLIEAGCLWSFHPEWSCHQLTTKLAAASSPVALGRVASSLRRRIERIPASVTPLMRHLASREEPATLPKLAESFHWSLAETEVYADELVQYDLVARVAHGGDYAYQSHRLMDSRSSLHDLFDVASSGARFK